MLILPLFYSGTNSRLSGLEMTTKALRTAYRIKRDDLALWPLKSDGLSPAPDHLSAEGEYGPCFLPGAYALCVEALDCPHSYHYLLSQEAGSRPSFIRLKDSSGIQGMQNEHLCEWDFLGAR